MQGSPDLNNLVLAHLKRKAMYRLAVAAPPQLLPWLGRYDIYWAFERVCVITVWQTEVFFDAHDQRFILGLPPGPFRLSYRIDEYQRPVRTKVDFHDPDSFDQFDRELRKRTVAAFWKADKTTKFNFIWESIPYGAYAIRLFGVPCIAWFTLGFLIYLFLKVFFPSPIWII